MIKRSDPHSSARAVIALLIVIVAFAILFIFETNKDNILFSGNFHPFLFLSFIGSSLLLSLLFLVNKPGDIKTSRTTYRSARKRKKRKSS